MYKYGTRSLTHKRTLHPDLQTILDDAIELMDLSIICGYRGELEQNIAYDAGRSKLRHPASKHNRMPSRAVDVVPYPVDWHDTDRFRQMVWMIKGIAQARGIKIRCGGLDFGDFHDWPHIELEGL